MSIKMQVDIKDLKKRVDDLEKLVLEMHKKLESETKKRGRGRPHKLVAS